MKPRIVYSLPERPKQPYPSPSSLFTADTDIVAIKPSLLEVLHTLKHRELSNGGRNDMCCPCLSVKRDIEAEKKLIEEKKKQMDDARKEYEKHLEPAKSVDDITDAASFLSTK